MQYDGFVFTDDAPEEVKKKRIMDKQRNVLFGSSNWNRKNDTPKERIRVVYIPQPQPRPMGYSQEPRYGYQKQAPAQKPINLIQSINNTQKALQKFSEQRRNAKLNENKRLKMEINQRLALLKTKNETARLKKTNWELKTAKARETAAKAKQGIGSAFGFIKNKVSNPLYGSRKKVNLPPANLPEAKQ